MLNHTRIILLVILFFQLVLGVMYAVRTPRWQAPDEPAHFNYVRTLAETGAFPVLQQGDYDQQYLEKIKAAKFPPELAIDSIRYESHQPPLYYALAAPFYLAARAAGLDPVVVLRLLNVALALALSVMAYWIFRAVFPAQPLLRLAAVGLMATLPMHIAMSAAVNNDALAELVLAVILLLAARRLYGKLHWRRYVLLGGLAYALALLTKTTIYSSGALLIVGELGAQQIAAARQGASVRRWATLALRPQALLKAGRTIVPLFGLALLISLPWFVRNAMTYGVTDLFGWTRHDAVVAGQPTTAAWIARYGVRTVLFDFFAISFKSFWAQFGWMGVLVNDRIYVLLGVLTLTAALGVALWLARLLRSPRAFPSEARWMWLLLGILVLLAAGAHVYYNLKYVQPQGRYLFPGLIGIAAFGAAGLNEWLNARYARWVFGLLYLAMLALDYIALAWFIVPQLAR